MLWELKSPQNFPSIMIFMCFIWRFIKLKHICYVHQHPLKSHCFLYLYMLRIHFLLQCSKVNERMIQLWATKMDLNFPSVLYCSPLQQIHKFLARQNITLHIATHWRIFDETLHISWINDSPNSATCAYMLQTIILYGNSRNFRV